MRLLITGGCGFIGTNFIYLMQERHPDWKIFNLDKLTYAGNRKNLLKLEQDENSGYTFIHGDICDKKLVTSVLNDHKIDAVVNFAAESHVDRSINDPAPFLTTNTLGAQNIMECARSAGIEKFVHVSTDEVYGTLGPDDPAFTEAHPMEPNSPYSASKAGADLMARAYFETYKFPVSITRCSNNYGPYQFPEKLIPLMFLKAQAGEKLPIYGDGSNIRDWIYVDDHCTGVELTLLKGQPGKVYNFGGAAEKTNLELVHELIAILGSDESLITYVKDRPGHDMRYAMNYALAEKELGFTPAVTFNEGIRKTIKWYQNNGPWLEEVLSGSYREFMDQWYGERK
ncbi:dTDP-glucose 4,6-dehydratase [Maridesulfovibrio hydrothermalis]|uniref:dTDP-glucose 4,6-dehydratase n=1 Tax=Maridesulfovibrio hydrothermalis AM13 = DSM 14728 TaxID=1121451 RepID=L0RC46_9BACT|nr:dTDP-glucose 4,6-dehydratase [Maridesulfovibrio hydrothermalis]CCO24324.1 putative dTDP-glucose 4,6-dehydratase [Maridesulfovibrio hydrothermalis AM13 = DSM 14728]